MGPGRGRLPGGWASCLGRANGSNSIARVGLKLARRGWLSVSTVASLLCTALLFAVAQFPPKPDDDPAVAVVMTVGAAALTFVIRSDEHDMMTRLVTFLRVVAALPLVLLILDGAWVALHRHYLTRPSLYVFAGIALACSVVLTIAYVTAARSEPFVSPWEQGFNVGNYADDDRPQGDYGEIWSQLNFDEAAIVVGSSEGEHFEFVWTEEAQTRLVRRLLELEYDSRKQATPQNALKRSPTR